MVTKQNVSMAKVRWENSKLTYAVALASLGVLKESKKFIIQSLVVTEGISKLQAQLTYETYYAEENEKCEALFIEMDELEKEFSRLQTELDNTPDTPDKPKP